MQIGKNIWRKIFTWCGTRRHGDGACYGVRREQVRAAAGQLVHDARGAEVAGVAVVGGDGDHLGAWRAAIIETVE